MIRFLIIPALLLDTAWVFAESLPGAHPVYAPPAGNLRFAHRFHRQIGCGHCHPTASINERPEAISIAGHSACQRCHPEADEGRGKDAACATCHAGETRRAVRPAASLKFSHRLHVEVPGGCARCHNPDSENRATGMFPTASRCEECHRSSVRSSSCRACHLSGPDGRLETKVVGGQLLPRGGHGGDDHGAGWSQSHGAVARRRESQCRNCHTSEGCERCHRGVATVFHIHPPDWQVSHPGEARGGLTDCGQCHRSQSDCRNCHRNSGVAESAPARPGNLRIHPAGYGDGLHSADARRNLSSCTSCHGEKDCIRCHGAQGFGRGISPHAPGFSGRCRLLRARNERPCLKCHTPNELGARCP